MAYTYTTQAQLRAAFWKNSDCKRVPGRSQNEYPIYVRMAWCDWIDSLARDGQISEALAQRATL